MQQFYLYVSILLNRLHSFNSNIFLPRNNDEQCCDYASFSRDGDEKFKFLVNLETNQDLSTKILLSVRHPFDIQVMQREKFQL